MIVLVFEKIISRLALIYRLTVLVNYHCLPRRPTNLKVDEKLLLSGDQTCDLRVYGPLLYHVTVLQI